MSHLKLHVKLSSWSCTIPRSPGSDKYYHISHRKDNHLKFKFWTLGLWDEKLQLVGERQAADGTKAQNPRRTGSEAETKIPALLHVTHPGMDRNSKAIH